MVTLAEDPRREAKLQNTSRLVLCALPAILVTLVFLPQTAIASCGDYVAIGNRAAAANSHERMDRSTPNSPETPVCNGPHCTQRTPAPTPAGPSLALSFVDHSAMLASSDDLGQPTVSRVARENSTSCSAGYPISIDRPPIVG